MQPESVREASDTFSTNLKSDQQKNKEIRKEKKKKKSLNAH